MSYIIGVTAVFVDHPLRSLIGRQQIHKQTALGLRDLPGAGSETLGDNHCQRVAHGCQIDYCRDHETCCGQALAVSSSLTGFSPSRATT